MSDGLESARSAFVDAAFQASAGDVVQETKQLLVDLMDAFNQTDHEGAFVAAHRALDEWRPPTPKRISLGKAFTPRE